MQLAGKGVALIISQPLCSSSTFVSITFSFQGAAFKTSFKTSDPCNLRAYDANLPVVRYCAELGLKLYPLKFDSILYLPSTCGWKGGQGGGLTLTCDELILEVDVS